MLGEAIPVCLRLLKQRGNTPAQTASDVWNAHLSWTARWTKFAGVAGSISWSRFPWS